jgi:hypothetical protein
MMSQAISDDPHFQDSGDTAVTEYRAVSGLALVGLGFGILSPLALLSPGLWILPGVGIVASGLALVRIAREQPALLGRKAAMVGLVVSVLMAAAAPAEWLTYRWIMDREARQIAAAWFGFLADDEPHKAYELTMDPRERRPLDDGLWQEFYIGSRRRQDLERFVDKKEVRALLALAGKALVQYYQTETGGTTDRYGHYAGLTQVYAVTFDDGGRKKTFFTSLRMRRFRTNETGIANWQIDSINGGIRPPALGG